MPPRTFPPFFFLTLILAASGCASLSESSISYIDAANALIDRGVWVRDTATYERGLGRLTLTVAGHASIPTSEGTEDDVLRIDVIKEFGSITQEQSYYLDSVTGRLRAINTTFDDGSFQLVFLAENLQTAREEILFAGFQHGITRDPSLLHLGSKTIGISGESSEFSAGFNVSKLDVVVGTNTTSAMAFGLRSAEGPFMTAITGSSFGDLSLTKWEPGTARLNFDTAASRIANSRLNSTSWDGVTPPEQSDSAFDFPLRKAHSWAVENDEGVRSFLAGNPDARVCAATYTVRDEHLPIQSFSWRITYCSLEGDRHALTVTRREDPLPLTQSSNPHEAGGSPMFSRALMPSAFVPIDEIYQKFVDDHRFANGTPAYVISADGWEPQLSFFTKDGPDTSAFHTAKFVTQKDEAFVVAYSMSDGSLHSITGVIAAQ